MTALCVLSAGYLPLNFFLSIVYKIIDKPTGIPSTSLATKGDSITFSTPTIEGTVLRRNKPDGSGTHPWKAEVTEGEKDVPASVVTDWYKSVYEPAYAATLPETSPTENEEV